MLPRLYVHFCGMYTTSIVYAKCKVLALHGLLTCHVACALAWYRCHTAVHIASTLVVPHRPHSELEFGIQSETNITPSMHGLQHGQLVCE